MKNAEFTELSMAAYSSGEKILAVPPHPLNFSSCTISSTLILRLSCDKLLTSLIALMLSLARCSAEAEGR